MKKVFTTFSVLFFWLSAVYSQINIQLDTTGVPNITNPMVVCGGDQAFSIQVTNVSTGSLSNIYITYDLPTGIYYSVGSLSGLGISEYNISNSNAPVFIISSLASATIISFTILASSNCNVLSVINNTDSLKAKIGLAYTKGSSNYIEQYKSSSITVYEPSLSMQVSNNSVTADIGDTISRTISIVNGGTGSLQNFTFYLVKPSDVDLLSLNNSNYLLKGDTAFISFSAIDFTNYGDGDALFEKNEKITFDENVLVKGCVNLQTNYNAYWGCDNKPCQEVNSYASISVNGTTPYLTYSATASQSTCYEGSIPNAQQIMIVNSGTGPAVNIEVEVYQANNSTLSAKSYFYSYIDDSSFTYQNGQNGNLVKPVIDSTLTNVIFTCFASATPKYYVRLQIPYLAVGDTAYINWNVYTCCISLNQFTTIDYGYKNVNGWNYEVAYENQCQTKSYVSGKKGGRTSSALRFVSQTSNNPADMNDGDTATFKFNTVSYVLLPGETNQWYLYVDFYIPECLKALDSTITFVDKNGKIWVPDSVVQHDDSIHTAYFVSVHEPTSFYLSTATSISIDITMDCATCSSNGEKVVTMNTFYVPNPNCSCESEVGTVTAQTKTHCAIACDNGGIWTYAYDIKRTSYGMPDNDDNGIPDTNGTLNLDSINYKTVLYKDTLTAFFEATVLTTSTNPTWKYVYAESAFSDQDLALVDASLTIYDQSANAYYTCNKILSTYSNNIFKYDLSADSLIAENNLPANFVYENGDSIWFNPRYVVTTNLGNSTTYTTTVENNFYASAIPNPNTSQDKYSCDNYTSYYNLAGFSYGNSGVSSITAGACDTVTVDQGFNSSIGACCFNFNGGNLFKYEYRPWSYISYIKMVLPYGYNFASATYKYNQTGGSSKSISTNTAMVPDSVSGDTLYFDIKKYYKEFSGNSFFISDDGYASSMTCKIVPTCSLTPNAMDTIVWINKFDAANEYQKNYSDYYYTTVTEYVNPYDNITSNVPELNILPTLAIVQGTDLTANWNFSVLNNSIYSNADNVWISFLSQSGNIAAKYIVNTITHDTIFATGDIFQLGKMSIASSANYDVICDYNTCVDDSFVVYTGWNCNGYPTSLSSSSCFSESVMLYLDPQPSKIDLEITESPTNVDLCDTAIFEAKISSVQLGALQNITITAQIPYGMHFFKNTSELLYPVSGNYVAISNPDSIGNNTYQWNIDANSLLIDSIGLSGISDTSMNSFKIHFGITTNCDFISGYEIEFTASGEYACGPITTLATHASLPVEIKGSTQHQYTSIDFSIGNATPCDTNIKCQVSILNLGPDTMLASNHYILEIPLGYTYVSGSFVNILNAASMTGPATDTLNGNIILDWTLPYKLELGDSAIFDVTISQNSAYTCGTHTLNMYTAYSGEAFCKATGDSCLIYFLSSTLSHTITDQQLSLDLLSFSSLSSNYSSTQDNIVFNGSLENTSATTITDSIYINLYFDTDNNGIYSAGDYFLGYSVKYDSVAPNTVYLFNDSVLVPTGFSCSIIAVLNTNGVGVTCSCLADELSYNSPSNYLSQLLNDTSSCTGNAILIGTTALNNINYTWSPSIGLSNSDSSQTYLNLQDSTSQYSLTYILTAVNNLGGCKDSDTLQITAIPAPDFSINASTSSVCYNDTVTINYSGTINSNNIYDWDLGNATILSGSGIGPYQIIFPKNGNATVMLTVTNGGCKNTDSVAISVGNIATLFASNDTVICTNGSANLSVDNGYSSYLWSTGDTSSSVSVSSGGLYWVKINNENCTAIDSVNVTLLALPSSGLNPSDSMHACKYTMTIGPLNGAYSYVWANGSTADSLVVNGSGFYTVNVSDGQCSTMDSIYVDFSNQLESPFDSASKSMAICEGKELEINANNLYSQVLWSTGDTTHSILVTQEGTYWVKQNNQYCTVSDTISIENTSDDNIKIANVFTPNNDGKNEYFNIDIDNVDNFEIKIYNRWGKRVFESDDYQFKWYGDVMGKKPEQDVYYWVMQYNTYCSIDNLKTKSGFVELILNK